MSKWIVGILVAGMVLVGGAAYGDYHPNPGIELPSDTYQVQVWQYDHDTNVWVLITADDTANAKCFAKRPSLANACNKQDWVVDIDVSASVTQWVEWSMTGTDWEWFVRKPGKYAADCISASLKSNYEVYIDYADFGDLVGTGGVDDTISVFYAQTLLGQTPPPQADFVSATALNDHDDTIVDSQDLHDGITWKLWNYIVVEECNSACEYTDDAQITLTLKGVKYWIDPLTGKFDLLRT